jgi:hypothetical protein
LSVRPSIHPAAQAMLDHEGDLAVIIGKGSKVVSEADALDYVLGYPVRSDVYERDFRLADASRGHFCSAKSFDSPTIASYVKILLEVCGGEISANKRPAEKIKVMMRKNERDPEDQIDVERGRTSGSCVAEGPT